MIRANCLDTDASTGATASYAKGAWRAAARASLPRVDRCNFLAMADSNLSDAPAPLSFSLGGAKAVKKPALKQEAKETERRDFILAMEGSKIVPSEQPETVPEKQYIIKKLENTIDYRGAKGKKFKPTFCPPTSDDKPGDVADKFELAAPQESLITEYGLQVRQPCTTGANGDAASTAPKQAYMAPADKELMAYKVGHLSCTFCTAICLCKHLTDGL